MLNVDFWDREAGEWVEKKHSGQLYLDITGADDGWGSYSELTPQEAKSC